MNPTIVRVWEPTENQIHGAFALIRMADEPSLFDDALLEKRDVVERLDLVFNDATEDWGLVKAPTIDDARRIWEFVKKHEKITLVVQCQNGVGRSAAVVAAIFRAYDISHDIFTMPATYNRLLYRLILEAAGVELPAEPLVSMVVRLKYAPDRLAAFVLSMQRQSYDNWEVIAVTDGLGVAPYVPAARGDSRVKFVETAKALGRWGYPHRQAGINAANGEWIVLTNDDNYYVPGFISQMVQTATCSQAKIVACSLAHCYSGWAVRDAGDIGAFLTHRSIFEANPWEGTDFDSDRKYFERVSKGLTSAHTNNVLLVKN